MKLTRRIVQSGFLALTLIGVFVWRGNAERWCPFGGVEALYTYVTEGNLTCSLAMSNFYILGGVILMTVLLRRAFCGYMCPLGTVSEWLQRIASRCGLRARRIPPKLDRAVSLLEDAVLVVILFFTWRTAELVFRGYDPCYALISRHGEDITFWAYVVSGAMVFGSLLVVMPFCRWLCPLAAVLNPFSRLGVTRITRDAQACVDCGQCAQVCLMDIPVDRVSKVTAARCLSCMNCVTICPQGETAAISWGPPGRWGDRLRASRAGTMGVLVGVLLFCTTAAVAASYLFPLPSYVNSRGAPPAVTGTVDLRIFNLGCRGKANLLKYYLERDDAFAIPGYIKLEAWPGPGAAEARISYDPSRSDESSIRQAITEPYYDGLAQRWRPSPFEIEGYDPLDLDEGEGAPGP